MLILSLLLSLSWRVGADESPAVITQAMTKILPRLEHALKEFEPGDLAVFDLDNTVFREVQTLGTDEWYAHIHHRMTERGLSKREASEFLEPVNRRIKELSDMRLMEPGLPEFVAGLQRQGVFVIGLTARHPNLARTTIDHLLRLGIDFSESGFPDRNLKEFRLSQLHNAFLWSEGVAFTDGSPKGLVLKALIERSGVNPKRVFAIDDRIQHVHTLVEALLELKIGGRVIHYLRAQEEGPFDPKVAELQYRVFKRLGRILSDEAARLILQRPRSCEKALAPSAAA